MFYTASPSPSNMSWWSAWRARQSDLDFQTKRADWLDGQLVRKEQEVKLLQDALVAERKAKDKFTLRHSDMMAQKAGLAPAFIKDAEPKKDVVQELSPADEEELMFLAQANMDADAEAGLPLYPIEHYVSKLKEMNYKELILN